MESKELAHKLDVEDEGKRVIKDDFKFLVGRVVVQVTEMMKIAPGFSCSGGRPGRSEVLAHMLPWGLFPFLSSRTSCVEGFLDSFLWLGS